MVLRSNFGEEFIYSTEALENTEKKSASLPILCLFSSDLLCNAFKDVSLWHLPKACQKWCRACNCALLEDRTGSHVGAAQSTAECRPRWWLESRLTRYPGFYQRIQFFCKCFKIRKRSHPGLWKQDKLFTCTKHNQYTSVLLCFLDSNNLWLDWLK